MNSIIKPQTQAFQQNTMKEHCRDVTRSSIRFHSIIRLDILCKFIRYSSESKLTKKKREKKNFGHMPVNSQNKKFEVVSQFSYETIFLII